MTIALAMELTLNQTGDWMRRFAAELHENREYLTRLDSAIGDADHGINMDRGFQAVSQKLQDVPAADLGALLKLVGSTLISTVGGASGPLYGTAFLRMGGALAGKTSASVLELATALGVAYEGVAARGKSTRGEKTMLDAFGPALDTFRAGSEAGSDLSSVAAAAAAAAEGGAAATVPMLATKGRASFLGEKSIGHQDPGATSTLLFFRTLAEAVQGDGR
jgi:dihydroxyacetone kinase-like protein